MASRYRITIISTFLLALAVVFPVFAGGWAVITLDELPSGVVAGEPLSVGFTVLQHGRTPMTDLEPTVTARLSNGKPITFFAAPAEKSGYYTATLTFPEEGNWEWSIRAFTMDQKMPALNVTSPSAVTLSQPVVQAEPSSSRSISPLLIVGILAIGTGVVGLVSAFRHKSRFTLGLTVVCLLIGVASLIAASASPAMVEAQSSSETLEGSSLSQVELGNSYLLPRVASHVMSTRR